MIEPQTIVNTEDQNHKSVLCDLITISDESILCSGWLKNNSVIHLLDALVKASNNNASVTIISNFKDTHKGASREISKLQRVRHITTKPENRMLHSKVYYFRTGNQYTAIVGSANLTEGGLISNDEFSIKLQGTLGDQHHKQIKGYLDRLIRELG